LRASACAAHGAAFRGPSARRVFVTAGFISRNTLALHFLLQRLEGLIDITRGREPARGILFQFDRIGILAKRRGGEGLNP
jgi:hypothetical protein